jgi:23S rRNA (guanosine2251-2'-O)-methyltransferase
MRPTMARSAGLPPDHDGIYGRNPVYELLRADRRHVYRVLVDQGVRRQGRVLDILELCEAMGVPLEFAERSALPVQEANHQGVVADAAAFAYDDLPTILERAKAMAEPPFVLLLDLIQDPQNLGTLLRTAEAVGVHGVVIPHRRAVGITPAVVSASSGASEHLHIARENLHQAVLALKSDGIWIAGLEASPEAKTPNEVDLTGPIALVVGSEGSGLRRLVRENCDFLLRIPMRGRIESLNAAVAGSIGLYALWEGRNYAGAAAPEDESAPSFVEH